METVLKISNSEIPIELYKATVIHSDKYTETSGGWFNLPVNSTLYTDIVYRLHEHDTNCQVKAIDIDLPVYTNQDVTLFSGKSIILGFIDDQTQKYYYTVKDFARILGFGISLYWFLLVWVLSAVIFYLIFGNEFIGYSLLSLVGFIGIFYVQRLVWNWQIRKSIDKYLQS